jgi:hypothetical protein
MKNLILEDHDEDKELRKSVDFVKIGATAFPVHGYARATLDSRQRSLHFKT